MQGVCWDLVGFRGASLCPWVTPLYRHVQHDLKHVVWPEVSNWPLAVPVTKGVNIWRTV